MAKYPQFVQANNPNVSIDEFFIIHAKKPRFIARLLVTDNEKEMLEFEREFDTGGRTTYKNYTASIGVIDFWDNPFKPGQTTQEQADYTAKLLRVCADWYYGILKQKVDGDGNR